MPRPPGELDISHPCPLCKAQASKAIFVKDGYVLARCQSCDLVYVDNPPTASELRKLYSFASNYHREFQDNESARKQYLKHARRHYAYIAKHTKRGRILDVGCSVGFFLKVARDNGWETLGVELSSDTAKLARERYGLEIIVGTLEDARLEPHSFDAVSLWDVIEHVQNPVGTMSIVNTILRDGGIVGLTTPNIDGLYPRVSYATTAVLRDWRHPEPPGHLFQFSKTTIKKLLERTGFEVMETRDKRIPILYSFGGIGTWLARPHTLLYVPLFVFPALVGPLVHSGDEIVVIARKTSEVSFGDAQSSITNSGVDGTARWDLLR